MEWASTDIRTGAEVQPQNVGSIDIAGLERHELEAILRERGVEAFRAAQLYRWIFKRGVTDFERMTDLSKALRSELAGHFTVSTPAVVTRERSLDGTEKFLLELHDHRRVEAVVIPDTPGQTFCVSTQASTSS